MLSICICSLFLCFSGTLLCQTLRDVSDQKLQSDLSHPRLPSPPSSTLSTFNATSSVVNTSVPDDLSVRCDGKQYGFKPDIDDCTSALRRQLVGRAQLTFGIRGSISTEEFLPLPYRLMGDAAHCYLEPILLNGVKFASASPSQIRNAASDLVVKCASRAEQGGIATNFGGDNNLALILSTYSADVECRGDFQGWRSCRTIVGRMAASKDTLVFGPQVDPGSQVILPHSIESDDKKCLGRIWYTKKEPDTASWFKMWEAVTAVYAVCLRNQKRGTVRGLGDHGNLFLTMTPQAGSLGNISLDDATDVQEDQSISDI